MDVVLSRVAYTETEVEGRLAIEDETFFTLERPWLNNRRGVSCVPDGEYALEPWTRPSGQRVLILHNEQNHVYRLPQDHDADDPDGRDLILIHPANFVRQLQGCIAPGMVRAYMWDAKTRSYQRAVSSSGLAMEKILARLNGSAHRLVIRPACGAVLKEE